MAEKARRLPPWAILAVGILWVGGVGVLDCLLPIELNFSMFYLPGIAWVAWGMGFWSAALLGATASVAITVIDFTFVSMPPRLDLLAWNVVTRFLVFAIVGQLTAKLSRLTQHLTSLVERRTEALKRELARHRATAGRLAEAMELARLAHWEYDVASGLFKFDERFYALYGTTVELEQGYLMSPETYVRQFLYPEDTALVADSIARALASTDPNYRQQVEHRIRRRDGEMRHLLVQAAITKDATGRAIQIHGVNQDITERKQAEAALREAHAFLEERVQERTAELQAANAALRESEDNYRRLLASMRDAFVAVDLNGRILEFNPAFEALLGYSPDELHQMTFMDVTPAQWHQQEARIISTQVLTRGFSDIYEKEYRRRDGTVFPIELRAFLTHDAAGKPAGMAAIIRDITERKQIEERLHHLNQSLEQRVSERTAALRESEERFRILSEASFEGIVLSKDGCIIDCNDQVVSILGYRREELLGRNPAIFAVPEWRARVLAGIQAGREVAVEHEALCKDGSRRVVEVRGRSPNGPGGLRLSAIRDVTERKAAEQRLADALEFNRALIAHAPIGITAYKADGGCILTNEAMAQLIGGSVAEVSQQNFRQLDSWRGSPLLATAETALRTGQAQRCEFNGTTTLGRDIQMAVHFVAFALKGEAHLLMLVRDITEQKRAERLLQAQRDLGVALSLTNDLGRAFDCLLEAAIHLEAIDCGGIYMRDTDSGGLRLAAHRGVSQQFVEQTSYHAPEAPQTRFLLQTQPLYAPLSLLSFQGDGTAEGLQALAIVPLSHEKTVIGSLILASHKEQAIPVQTRVAVEAIAAQTAGAIARIKAETERGRLERQLLEVSEREQARMGQDIHDGLCQQLVSLAFDANSLEQQLTASGHTQAAQARRIAHYLDQAITEARQLSRGLFPIRLDGEGLPSALEELARSTSERFRLRCVCETQGPIFLPSHTTATHLYRIAQEALHNALKHARPRTICISLQQRAGLLELRVEDDGTGLPAAVPPNSRGMGLHIMDYRARSFGGRLEFSRNPNGGTTVCCCVPC